MRLFDVTFGSCCRSDRGRNSEPVHGSDYCARLATCFLSHVGMEGGILYIPLQVLYMNLLYLYMNLATTYTSCTSQTREGAPSNADLVLDSKALRDPSQKDLPLDTQTQTQRHRHRHRDTRHRHRHRDLNTHTHTQTHTDTDTNTDTHEKATENHMPDSWTLPCKPRLMPPQPLAWLFQALHTVFLQHAVPKGGGLAWVVMCNVASRLSGLGT